MIMAAKARVGLVQGADRRHGIYQALELVRADVEPKLRSQVLIKPNFLSSTNQLVSTHADAVRGVLDFLMSAANPPEEVLIAEGANEKYSGEAFVNFAYAAALSEYGVPIRLIDLHQETEWVETSVAQVDGSQAIVRMAKLVLDCPCTISLALAKTHDTCVVTLALKNMVMGALHKQDRVHMHGVRSHAERKLPDEAQVLNVNLMRVARFLSPGIAVIDGTRGVQGNGPGGDNAVDFQVVAASADVFAVDSVITKAMGFEPMELALPCYGQASGLGVADLEQIEILGAELATVMTPFLPHERTPVQMQWAAPHLAHYLAGQERN